MSKKCYKIDKRAQKFSRLQAFIGKSPNEIADEIKRTGDGFTASAEWRSLRQQVINHYGGRCMCCGHVPKIGVNVDHIKPRKFFPELALDFNNLQVLCPRCNKAKGNKHHTDYRRLSQPGVSASMAAESSVKVTATRVAA